MREHFNISDNTNDDLIKEARSVLRELELLLGSTKQKAKADIIMEELNEFENLMIDRCLKQGSSEIVVHIMETSCKRKLLACRLAASHREGAT